MRRKVFGCGVAFLFAGAVMLGVGSAQAQQGVGATVSAADRATAAAAASGGHYAIELTPTREGAAKGAWRIRASRSGSQSTVILAG